MVYLLSPKQRSGVRFPQLPQKVKFLVKKEGPTGTGLAGPFLANKMGLCLAGSKQRMPIAAEIAGAGTFSAGPVCVRRIVFL